MQVEEKLSDLDKLHSEQQTQVYIVHIIIILEIIHQDVILNDAREKNGNTEEFCGGATG